jgi:hypothetical protein
VQQDAERRESEKKSEMEKKWKAKESRALKPCPLAQDSLRSIDELSGWLIISCSEASYEAQSAEGRSCSAQPPAGHLLSSWVD